MDIFTDASLNDKEKIAGIGMVFVSTPESLRVQSGNGYLLTNNIETAELFAISKAIMHAVTLRPDTIRLFSDSKGALRKIQRVFHHPNQRQIHTIENPDQKEILYHISASFELLGNVDFSFYHIRGHQTKPAMFTVGYYNMLADQEASSGRLLGEMIKSAGVNSADPQNFNKVTFSQHIGSLIVSPAHISFHYEDSPKKPKLISRYSKHKKENTIRRGKQNGSRGR